MMNFHKEYKNSFDSSYLNTGYYIPSGKIAATTSIETPNQIAELAQRLNLGAKNVEISGPLDPSKFQQVPAQHFEELRRAAKLSEASLSLHAPMIDIVGFSEQGNWSDYERKRAEGFLKDVLDKSARMDVGGNIPVTVHTNRGTPAFAWEKDLEPKKPGEIAPQYKTLFAIDQESGRILPVEYEKKNYLGRTEIKYPQERLDSANQTTWDDEKLKVLSLRKDSDDILYRRMQNQRQFEEIDYFYRQSVATPEQIQKRNNLKREIDIWDEHLRENDQRVMTTLEEMHHRFASYPDRKNVEEYSNAQRDLEAFGKEFLSQRQHVRRLIEEGNQRARNASSQQERNAISQDYNNRISEIRTIDTEEILSKLSRVPAPQVLIPVDDFAKQKASDTIANAAFHAYTNLGGEKAPTLAVENWHPETVLSRGENFREFLDLSRKKFADKLVANKGISQDSAKRAAEKLIGATWDVSHINMLKRFGYSDSEIAQEVSHIAKPGLVKKIHLADNFGYGDTHLVPGMGNAPIAEQLRILEKYGALEGAQQVLEAGAFDVQFKESSFPYALEAFNSPLYSYSMQPKWGSAREVYGSYNYGFGDVLPDLHFSSHYGAGFSNLPRELGGQMNQDRSRFSGDQIE